MAAFLELGQSCEDLEVDAVGAHVPEALLASLSLTLPEGVETLVVSIDSCECYPPAPQPISQLVVVS